MKNLLIPMLLSLCTARLAEGAPLDSVLTAYALSETQLAQFSIVDGTVSEFWLTDWETRDSIMLTPSINSHSLYSSFENDNDARVCIKAASSDFGFYFCITISDNAFMVAPEDANSDSWQYDICDLYLDVHDADELYSAREDDNMWLNTAYGWALSHYSKMVQMPVGGSSPADSFSYTSWETCFFSWDGLAFIPWSKPSDTFHGLSAELVKNSDQTKTIELFYPWSELFSGECNYNPLLPQIISMGSHFAFVLGYNDRDSATDSVACLRLKISDPFDGNETRSSYQSWGDLVIDKDIAPQKVSAICMYLPAYAKQPQGGVSEILYTLKGQKVIRRSQNTTWELLISKRSGRTIKWLHTGR